jgi:sulfur-carrier protein
VIRVVLPAHLKSLARVNDEVQFEIDGTVTMSAVVSAIEARYPMLVGTIRDHRTHKRRPFIRYFACQRDLSHDSPETPLPEPIVNGSEPVLIIGAMAGG